MFEKSGKYNVLIVGIAGVLIPVFSVIICFAALLYYVSCQDAEIKELKDKVTMYYDRGDATSRKLSVMDDNYDRSIKQLMSETKHLHRDALANKERMILTTMVMNENFAAIAAGRPKDILYIEPNWKIRRLPKYLEMSPDSLNWFERFVEPKESK